MAQGFGPFATLQPSDIRLLRSVLKLVGADWQDDLRSVAPGASIRKQLCTVAACATMNDPLRTALFYVYARRGDDKSTFSVGLGITDVDDEHHVPLVRVNSHKNLHYNRFPKPLHLPPTPHVHYLTSRGMALTRRLAPRNQTGDQYALSVGGCKTLDDALWMLAKRANIGSLTPTLDWEWWRQTERRLP
jgi:hypothetical protein